MWKRKKEELERSGGGEEEIFKRSKLVERSPVKELREGRERIDEWMKEMGNKFERMVEEFREGFKSQERRMNEMMEEMRREFGDQMREWGKEREEIKKSIEIMRDRTERIEQRVIQVGGKGE